MPLGSAHAAAGLGPMAVGLRHAASGFSCQHRVRLGAHGVLRLR
jgi:hypothetical protein